MNTTSKLALGAVLAALLLLLSPLGSMLTGSSGGEGATKAAAPASPVLPEPAAPPEDLELSSAGEQRTDAAEPASDAHPDSPAPAPAAEPDTGVRMRFVDGAGVPVGGVTVALEGSDATGGVSDGSGVAEAWMNPATRSWGGSWRVLYQHPTFAGGSVGVELEPEQLKELGDIVLSLAGGLTVLVQDANGAPVEGAWVRRFRDSQLGASKRHLDEERVEQSLPKWGSSQVTDSLGRLRLEDLPEGKVRVWAGHEGHLAAYSELIEVRPGEHGEEVVVSLGVLDPELFIRGRVVDPTGAPVANARVSAEYSHRGGSGSTSFGANEQGRFVLAYSPKAPRTLRASDVESRYGPAVAEGVVGGDEVVLRLTDPQRMLVTVSSREEGVELQGLQATVYKPERRGVLLFGNKIEREGSVLSVPLPDEPFLLEVQAEGHERLEVGTYEGRAAPRELEVVLRSLPGVSGRVTAGGEPLAGARVELFARADRLVHHNGFPVRVRSQPWANGVTDAEGAFDLTLRMGGEFYLRVEGEGHAPAEQGPMPIDPERGLSGLAVELTSGGSLEGFVTGAGQTAGCIVAISRGDAHAQSQRTDAEGHYRFEHLTPGPWLVELVDEEISPYSSSTSSSGASFQESDIESNCMVVEGQTTRHDLSLTGGGQAVLVGTLLLDGGGASDWTAQLMPVDRGALAFEAERDTLGSDGAFRLEVSDPGEYWLSLRPPLGGVFMLYERVLLVPGENTWSGSFARGGVSFSNAPSPEGARVPDLVLVGSDGRTGFLMAVGGPLGLTATDSVPVMPCQLRRVDPSAMSGLEDLEGAGTLLLEVELRAGEIVEVDIP